MAATGHGATFLFDSDRGKFIGGVTNISVDFPSAEIVDMTSAYDGANTMMLAPTGAWKGGSISVEFVAGTATTALQTLIRGYGSLTFTSPGFSVTRQAILESGSQGVAVGDVVKGTLKFLMTDYYGT